MIEARFALGDLALKVAPMGEVGHYSNSTVVLNDFADEVGIEFNLLQQYRQMANVYPEDRRHYEPGETW